MSTLNPTSVSAYRDKISWAKSSASTAQPLRVETVTLDFVLERNSIPYNFDLLVVDVEGHEEPIVKSLLDSKWRPHVMIVELCDFHPDFATAPELQEPDRRLRQLILAHGYSERYVDHINSIFAI